MRKAVAGFWWSPTVEGTPALIVTAIFFALGGLMGSLLAFFSTGDGAAAMSGYLEGFLLLAREGPLRTPAVSVLLWRTLRWPLAVFVLGFSALGLLGIPVVTALRGFCLAFSVAAFSRACGGRGLMLAVLLLGIPALLCVPAFLVLATQSFSAACTLASRSQGRRELPYHRAYFLRCGVCAAATGLGLLLEQLVVPSLVAGWAGMLL